MVEKNFLDDLTQKISGLMPESLQQFKADMEKNIHAVIQNGLAKLDIVTREEFDAQASMLKRSRMKLEELEKRIAELEQHTKGKHK